ncbi:MAG: hypothetical protein QOF66_1281 [Mycobacterium sp.]|nr:hypothetical protein [Mycobacterium sp.]
MGGFPGTARGGCRRHFVDRCDGHSIAGGDRADHGGTQHPLTGPTDQSPFVTAYLNNAINSYISPAAAAGTGTMGPATNAVAVYGPEEFFPVFGSRTFDESTAIGLKNLHNCLNASGCVYNTDPAVAPEVGTAAPVATDKFIVFGYSQSAVVAALAKRDVINNYHAGDPSTSFLSSMTMARQAIRRRRTAVRRARWRLSREAAESSIE